MRLHRNAKTTPMARVLIVQRVEAEGWTVEETAEAFGVSSRTVHKWRKRLRERGLAGAEDGSSVPGRIPHRTGDRRVAAILRLRRQRWTQAAIAHRLRMPRSTVGAVVRRHNLGRLPPLNAPPPLVLGDATGVIDTHMRVLPADATAAATQVAVDAMADLADAAQGLHIDVQQLTGTGTLIAAYISLPFATLCAQFKMRHIRIRPYTPRTNGKAGHFIQTLLREWAYVRPYRSSLWRQRALFRYLRRYNGSRRHSALNFTPPLTRLKELAA